MSNIFDKIEILIETYTGNVFLHKNYLLSVNYGICQ